MIETEEKRVREHIRNVAIIAHVDHGKTTLVDKLLRQGGAVRAHEDMAERVMDSNSLERERGITILAKNTAVRYNEMIINIVDTPGHADFSGEVERTLVMVDGVLLLVDAFEGPMPQTKFVLRKSLEMGLMPIVVINKIDRPDARPKEVVDLVYELFMDLNATDKQLDFPIVYTSAKLGVAKHELDQVAQDLRPLFETIVEHVPPPVGDPEAPFQMMVASIEYDNFVGRMALGRISRGKVASGGPVARIKKDGTVQQGRISRIMGFEGLRRAEWQDAAAGDVVLMAGFEDVEIGDTLSDTLCLEALNPLIISEPTLSVHFIVNNSPFSGREGKFVTTRNLRDRLMTELRSNVSLRVEETDSSDVFKVSGRGELHLSILMENMRREGYEFQVSMPQVIYKEIDGVRCEPMEFLVMDVEEPYVGSVMQAIGKRRGELRNMAPSGNAQVRIEFEIPARGLLGYRTEFLTQTRGTGIMNHTFHGFQPYKGDLPGRERGSLISMAEGETVAFGLFNVQERGTLFIGPGVPIYEGMVIGETSRNNDLAVNACKKKQLSNMRASGSDDALLLTPPRQMSLEMSLEFLADDELLEVTPKSLRLRKRYLTENERKRMSKK